MGGSSPSCCEGPSPIFCVKGEARGPKADSGGGVLGDGAASLLHTGDLGSAVCSPAGSGAQLRPLSRFLAF